LSTDGATSNESAALRMQTDAYDDEGREYDLKMELQSLEGLAIDCRPTMTINHPSKNVNVVISPTKARILPDEDVSESQEGVEEGLGVVDG